MKGIVLAGGLGTRLLPLTRITNKHLLPVFDRPMIYYPLQTLINAGITDILLVTGGHHAGDFLRLLGNGREFGLAHLNYTYQEGEGGIAAALALAEPFACGPPGGGSSRSRTSTTGTSRREISCARSWTAGGRMPGRWSRCIGRATWSRRRAPTRSTARRRTCRRKMPSADAAGGAAHRRS